MLDEEFLLHRADMADTGYDMPVRGRISQWLKNNEQFLIGSVISRFPLLNTLFWLITIGMILPVYSPETGKNCLHFFFCYAFARLFFIAYTTFERMHLVVHERSVVYRTTVLPSNPYQFDDITHVVIICMYAEPVEKIAETLETLAGQEEGLSKQIIVVMATESRDVNGVKSATKLRHRFAPCFKAFYHTVHEMAPGEVIGKASNENWAARCAKYHLVDEMHMDPSRIIMTSCDADTFFDEKYFAEITARFCNDDDRYISFYQSPVAQIANLHELPTVCKARYITVSLGHLGLSGQPSLLQPPPFSTYSLSLNLAIQGGYWDPSVISEDSHVFLQSFFATKGQVRVHYTKRPTCCDVPVTTSSIKTIKACYDQHRRWMWGVLDFGYAIVRCCRDSEIPVLRKACLLFLLYEYNCIIPSIPVFLGLYINLYHVNMPIVYMVPGVIFGLLNFVGDQMLREIALDGRMNVNCSNAHKSIPYRMLYWPIIFLLTPVSEIIFSTLATYHAHVSLCYNSVLVYKTSPKMVSKDKQGAMGMPGGENNVNMMTEIVCVDSDSDGANGQKTE